MRLANETRQHGDDEQHEEPRRLRGKRDAQRREREDALRHAEQLREQRDATGRPLPRALEMIVERRILELVQIERRRVLHDADADPIREQVAEQAFDKPGRAREELAASGDSHLERDEHPEVVRGRRAVLRER